MKSLKLTPEEAEKQGGVCCDETEDGGPKYPWGTSLCLGTEAMDKLGVGLMPVGTEVIIIAKARVTGTSSRERQSGMSQDMDIQLTAMEITAAQADSMGKSAARLYPDKEG